MSGRHPRRDRSAEVAESKQQVSGHCQKSKMRYVTASAPTCLPATILRDMLKTFRVHAVNGADADAFKPYAAHGGRDSQSNHKTKAGLLRTVKQALGNLPEATWDEPEVAPDNPYLYQMALRQPWQKEPLLERIRTQYFKPQLGQNFDESDLSEDQVADAIRSMLRNHTRFALLGVVAPSSAGTQHLLSKLHGLWRVPHGRHGQRRYTTFGVVWNTATDAGSHWVAALFLPAQRRFEFFDSMGNAPNALVGCQMRVVKEEIAKLGGFSNHDWRGRHNKRVHQRGGTQCGVYATWFFMQRIGEKRSMEQLESKRFTDAQACQQRPNLFRRPDSRVLRVMAERQRIADENEAEQEAKAREKPRKKTAAGYAESSIPYTESTSYRVRIVPAEKRKGAADPEAQTERENGVFNETRCAPVQVIVYDDASKPVSGNKKAPPSKDREIIELE